MLKKKVFASISKIFLGLLAVASIPSIAFAACTSPAGVEGQLQWISGVGQVRFCNGSAWVSLYNISSGAACTGAGKISYVSSEIMYCNGSNWIKAAPPTNHGGCTGTTPGKFYYDTIGNYYWFCNGSNWRRMGP